MQLLLSFVMLHKFGASINIFHIEAAIGDGVRIKS